MADSLARISSMIESAKDLTIEAAVSASARLTDTPTALRPSEITKLLNSRVDRDVLNGMKCVISIISRGGDGLPYFADVVKNVTTSNQKIKNLVLVYLTRYAELEPDIALLSINSIQKSLNDKNVFNRAKSIRALAGIRISSIIPILVLSLKRTVSDPSPQVRAATAIAIGKVYDKEDSSRVQLLEFLTKLLCDSNSNVVTHAIKTYYKISPQLTSSHKRWDPIHGNFRRFCSILPEIDPWGQAFLIQVLTEYSRKFLPIPKLILTEDSNIVMEMPQTFGGIPFDYEVEFDPDLNLLLESMKKIVYSKSESVIISIAKSVYSLAPPMTFIKFQIHEALIRIATSSKDSQIRYCVLQLISEISFKEKSIFAAYFKKFYLYPDDSIAVSSCKLQILASLATEVNIRYIIEELKYYSSNSTNTLIAAEAIKSIGRCSQIAPEWNKIILSWCLRQIKSTSGILLNEVLTVIRYLLQQKVTENISTQRNEIIQTIYKLSLLLNDEEVNLQSEAKASAIWIVGEMTTATENSIGPDVLRLLIKNFAKEPVIVRYQILMLAAKVYSYELDRIYRQFDSNLEKINEALSTNIIYKMYQHTLQLAKYDSSCDTRDKARMLNVLLGNNETQLASLFLQAPKAVPIVSLINSIDKTNHINLILEQYLMVPDWSDPQEIPDSLIRKEIPVREISYNISFNTTPSPPTKASDHAISSELYHREFKKPEIKTKQTYQLQSLDEFFGSEEEELIESSSGDDDSDDDDDDDEVFDSSDDTSEEEEVEDDDEEEDEEELDSSEEEEVMLLAKHQQTS